MAVELVVLTVREGRLEALLVRHPNNVWSLPGGPVAGGTPLEPAGRDWLARQAGVRDVALEQLYTFDREDGASLAVAELALIAADRHPLAPGADVVEVRWFPLADRPALAPEAERTLEYGHGRLRAKTAYAPVAVQLLPERFTLGELQAVYEAVLDAELDTRNFRRDVLAAGLVEPTGARRAEGPGRPARLYRSTGAEFAVVARERRVARAIAATARSREA